MKGHFVFQSEKDRLPASNEGCSGNLSAEPRLFGRSFARDDEMQDFWWSYWWLIFPVGAFVFGAWDRWLSYQRSRDTLEVVKAYAAQGKEPPAEITRRLEDDADEDDDITDGRRGRRARRYRRYYRWGPYREFRAAIITGSVAAAFWFAVVYGYIPGAVGPFRLVAVILTFVAVANLLFAVVGSRLDRR